MNRKLNYDGIAESFDQRYRLQTNTGESMALSNLVRKMTKPSVLEVGCGTGHWLGELESAAGSLYGLDASIGMLNQAKIKGIHASWAQGDASKLPFDDSNFDFLFCLNAIHHFSEPGLFIQEAYRVILPGGMIAVIGGDIPWRRHSWYIYTYFEGTYETDLRRFPTWETLAAWMKDEGFRDLELVDVDHIVELKQGHEVLLDPFLDKKSCSQLALLSRSAYEKGIEQIKVDIDQAEKRGEEIVFITDFKIQMLTGHKW